MVIYPGLSEGQNNVGYRESTFKEVSETVSPTVRKSYYVEIPRIP